MRPYELDILDTITNNPVLMAKQLKAEPEEIKYSKFVIKWSNDSKFIAY